MTPKDLQARIVKLEQEVRWTRRITAALAIGLGVAALAGWASSRQSTGVLRARALIIEDEQGRGRIILGAPVPDPSEGKRISEATGMVINDSAGAERFGLGLMANGDMSMGFDAPPGTGDGRNRERINLGATSDGGAFFRLMDRRTLVPFRLYTDEENRAWAEFLTFEFEGGRPTKVVRRRLGFEGWDTISQPMGQ